MGQKTKLTASDGFRFGAYRTGPAGPAKGAVVVIQEIFGVNHHIRAVCDWYADRGYVAVAPALFDRIQPNFESGYSAEEVATARKFTENYDWPAMLRDTQAAIDSVAEHGPVSIVGFCLGGSVAYVAAARLTGLSAAIGYYGGVARFADERPKVPTQLHFGELDKHIPLSDVETVRLKRPEVEVYVYEGAGHGFNCDERGSFHHVSAERSRERSLSFLEKHASR